MDLSKPQQFDTSCPSSWGHGKILSKRLIPERLYAVFDEVGSNNVNRIQVWDKLV